MPCYLYHGGVVEKENHLFFLSNIFIYLSEIFHVYDFQMIQNRGTFSILPSNFQTCKKSHRVEKENIMILDQIVSFSNF